MRDVQQTHDFWVESGISLTRSPLRFGSRHARWRAPRGGTRLTVTIVIGGGGLTLTRAATTKAPPRP